MRITRKFIFSGALVALLGQVSFHRAYASQCDCAESVCQSECDCQNCCDSGLLDIVDRFLGGAHRQVNRTMRLLHTELGLGLCYSKSTCDSYCDGDCQLACDSLSTGTFSILGPRANGCPACQNGDMLLENSSDVILDSAPEPPTLSGIGNTNRRAPIGETQKLPKSPPTPTDSSLRHQPPPVPGETLPAPWEKTPSQQLPDSMVDPFEDESPTDPSLKGASRSDTRTIRGNTIQYRRSSGSNNQTRLRIDPTSTPNYRQRFDPQASNAASSADYWAGADESPQSNANKVSNVSDQVPTLQQIHKRAYSLRLADQNTAKESRDASETLSAEIENTKAPARLPPNASNAQPLKAPVQQVLRLKAQPAYATIDETGPSSNPLR